MYTYSVKVNRKTYYYTGKDMSTDINDAHKVYTQRMAIEMQHSAKLIAMRELGTSSIELTIVDDSVKVKENVGVFLTEEID